MHRVQTECDSLFSHQFGIIRSLYTIPDYTQNAIDVLLRSIIICAAQFGYEQSRARSTSPKFDIERLLVLRK